LKLLGIPISGMMYYVNWKLTTAQLELLASDVSVVDYGSHKKKKEQKKRKKGEFDDTAADKKALKEAAEDWKERHGEDESGATGLSIMGILGKNAKSDVAVKIKNK
jgi:hypothetical protein